VNPEALLVVAGPAAGARIEVATELLVGRSSAGPGALGGDPQLSRRHALFTRQGPRLAVTDLGSTNGTLVNGRLITGPTVLAVGDRVELGGTAIEVRPALSTGPNPDGDVGGTFAASWAPEPGLAPFAPPAVDRHDSRGGGLSQVLLAIVAVAAIAAVVILLLTRTSGTGGGGGGVTGSQTDAGGGALDGTAYVETNVAQPDANSVLALHYSDGSFRPLRISEYPTGGSGSHDLSDSGVLDADQQVIANPAGTLLFAVNQGSDTVAAFHIAADGSLTPVRGSPFPSGGTAPASLGLSGDILVVANKAHDGVRDLTDVQANYATLRIARDGSLHPTGFTFELPPRSSPTQVYVAPGGKLVFATEETGLLRAFSLSASGALTQAPGSPWSLPNSLFAHGRRPRPVWPAGLSADAAHHVLYTGIPNYGSIVAYDYDSAGTLTFDSEVSDHDTFLPCWSVVSADGRRLYFDNAGTDNVSVWDIATDPRHPQLLQTVPLRGGGNPWNLHLDPDGRFLYTITPRDVKQIPAGEGQLLHSLAIGADGTLTELPSSPIPLPVALDTNPIGLTVVPRR
jgi:DNA-binding beta-propeller fold protein YncE